MKCLTLAIVLGMAGQSWAAQIMSFEPDPTDPATGFGWNGSNLFAGTGMGSNGDGNSQAMGGTFTQPGLRSSTPFLIHGVSSSSTTGTSTTFYDTAGSITGLTANGNAGNFGGLLIQNLNSGTFSFLSSADTTGGAKMLLEGTITNASLSGIAGSSTGSVVSATVTYTNGLIFDQLASHGFSMSGNSSWSLVNINPTLAIDGSTGRLRPFNSNSSGLFDASEAPSVIPVPAAFPAGMALLGVFGLMRRKMRVC